MQRVFLHDALRTGVTDPERRPPGKKASLPRASTAIYLLSFLGARPRRLGDGQVSWARQSQLAGTWRPGRMLHNGAPARAARAFAGQRPGPPRPLTHSGPPQSPPPSPGNRPNGTSSRGSSVPSRRARRRHRRRRDARRRPLSHNRRRARAIIPSPPALSAVGFMIKYAPLSGRAPGGLSAAHARHANRSVSCCKRLVRRALYSLRSVRDRGSSLKCFFSPRRGGRHHGAPRGAAQTRPPRAAEPAAFAVEKGRGLTKPSPAKLPTTRTRRLCKSVGARKVPGVRQVEVPRESARAAAVRAETATHGTCSVEVRSRRRKLYPSNDHRRGTAEQAAAPPRRGNRAPAPGMGSRPHEIRGKYPIRDCADRRVEEDEVRPRRCRRDVATAATGPKTPPITAAPTVRIAHAPGIARSRAERRWTHANILCKSATHRIGTPAVVELPPYPVHRP